jgi:hypothetical protein
MLGQQEMARRGNGQEFREAFYNPEEDYYPVRHRAVRREKKSAYKL